MMHGMILLPAFVTPISPPFAMATCLCGWIDPEPPAAPFVVADRWKQHHIEALDISVALLEQD